MTRKSNDDGVLCMCVCVCVCVCVSVAKLNDNVWYYVMYYVIVRKNPNKNIFCANMQNTSNNLLSKNCVCVCHS